ncbi:MAG: hypothetical protein KIT17_03875 [Rubrivivax sp.]|nr:hypothetical protein [Rubrivivax sp.]
MLRPSIRALVAWSLAVCGGPGWAGLSLDAALSRDREWQLGNTWSSVAPLTPAPGLWLAAGGPRIDAPQLTADVLAGRGGARFVSQAGGRGPWRWQLGVAVARQISPRASLEGSAVVLDVGDEPGSGEFYAAVQRRHWGPGWAGSLILDGAAPAVANVGWRRTAVQSSRSPWLGWLGPFAADFFAGRLQGHDVPRRPTFMGARVQLGPHPRVEVGLSRTIQWGGRGRDESSSSFFNAIIGNDNVGFDGITKENEPGNQLAGIDVRWTFDEAKRTALYAQLVGEDEAGHFTSRHMLLLGVDATRTTERGSARFFAEIVDTLAGRIADDPRPTAAYRHSVYEQGYTQQHFPLGHPVGGDAWLVTAGWILQRPGWQAKASLAAGRAEPTAQFFTSGRVLGADGALQIDAGAATRIGLSAQWWRDPLHRRHAVQLWWQGRLP